MVPDEYDLETSQRGTPRDRASATGFELRVVAGPDAGRAFLVHPNDPSPALIGKSPVCTVRLVDPEVSRRHASLEAVGATLRLVDLGSTNGTFVNGLRVFDAALVGGEQIHVGATLMSALPREGPPSRETSATSFGPVIGASAAMRRLHPVFERRAQARVAVVIEGETGMGKEPLAEALH